MGALGYGAADSREGGVTFALRPEPAPGWTLVRSDCGSLLAVSWPSRASQDSGAEGPAGGHLESGDMGIIPARATVWLSDLGQVTTFVGFSRLI